jgi:hypothetical protein
MQLQTDETFRRPDKKRWKPDKFQDALIRQLHNHFIHCNLLYFNYNIIMIPIIAVIIVTVPIVFKNGNIASVSN